MPIVQPGFLPRRSRHARARDRSVEQPFRATSIAGPRYREPDARQHVRAGLLAGAGKSRPVFRGGLRDVPTLRSCPVGRSR
jgi:hypothetical protein